MKTSSSNAPQPSSSSYQHLKKYLIKRFTGFFPSFSDFKFPKKDVVDFFDKLPEPILHLIVSRLPTTEEAVRTSVLSTRWRDLWTLIPSLDIDCNRRLKPSTNFDKNKFKEFVDLVLVNQTLDLESVRLSCGDHYDMSTVARWMDAAIMRKVKSLDLSFYPDFVIQFPSSMIKCESLEVLRLDLNKTILFGVNIFPALRVLELNNVGLPVNNDKLTQFLKRFPLLEELSLIDCYSLSLWGLSISSPTLKTLRIDYRISDISAEGFCQGICYGLRISCPKLVVLEYAGTTREFSFENLESLEKAVIHPEPEGRQDKPLQIIGDTLCELFAGVSHVKSLSLNLFFIQAISHAGDPDGAFPASLPNLKTLEISTTIDDYSMEIVLQILKCSPSLESLYLSIEKENLGPDLCKLDEVLAHHLKRVEFLEFNGEKWKLDMARFLLEHGRKLEEMVFIWRDKVSYRKKSMNTLKEVTKFLDSKASSTVKLITLLKE